MGLAGLLMVANQRMNGLNKPPSVTIRPMYLFFRKEPVMALLNVEFNNLNDLLVNQLQDLYDAEQRLTDALPKMAKAASSPQLKAAFNEHLTQTQNHVRRLEQIFGQMGCEAEGEKCEAMAGLVKEGSQIINAKGDDMTRDAGLIAAAQKVEHYEIASYGTVRAFANTLGLGDVARTLQQTLDEEGETDQKLTQLALSTVNMGAQA
jgi:ferritin-like metal-binding protein YciE